MSNAEVRHHLIDSGVQKFSSIGWDFGDPLPDTSVFGPKDTLWIVDLPLDPVRPWVEANPTRTIWIDHHRTAIVDPKNDLNLKGLRCEGIAACRLVRMWAFGVFNPMEYETTKSDNESWMTFLIGLRDVWKHRGTSFEDDCTNLDIALKSEPDDLLFSYLANVDAQLHVVVKLVENGRKISAYVRSEDAESADRGAMLMSAFGLRVLALNTQGRGSGRLDFLAKKLASQGEDIDALMVYGLAKDRKFNISLYHAPGREHLDLSFIAKMYKGGGHPGACGLRLDIDQMVNVLNGGYP